MISTIQSSFLPSKKSATPTSIVIAPIAKSSEAAVMTKANRQN